jgi:hypothetical protein
MIPNGYHMKKMKNKNKMVECFALTFCAGKKSSCYSDMTFHYYKMWVQFTGLCLMN